MIAAAVVVAAGRGTRLPGAVPKPFLDLGGKTVLERSVGIFTASAGIDGVVVVLAPEEIGGERARAAAAIPGVSAVVPGGPSRSRSSLAGVEAAEAEIVLVHDAARPFASPALVAAVLAATKRHGAAVPVLRVGETVKRDDGTGFAAATLDRDALRLAQTPQGARRELLLKALARAKSEGSEPTDDAEALERAGIPVALIAGEPANIKITTPEDWAEARRRLAPSRPAMRVRIGHGYDIHRFGADRVLKLGGVEFPGEAGLAGHSDADVVLHAAMDAVLGAAGLPDIGHHFPPGDPSFAGADSRALAREVARLLRARGWEIGNLDLTLLAETPRIGPRREAMREAIATAFSVDLSRIGVKATTLERLGSLGRSEGIACHAVALLHPSSGEP